MNFITLKLVQEKYWIPEPLSNAAGKEISVMSYMAPFLRISIFAEDDVIFIF